MSEQSAETGRGAAEEMSGTPETPTERETSQPDRSAASGTARATEVADEAGSPT